MYKMDLAINNLQWLICHKTKTKQNQLKTVIEWKILRSDWIVSEIAVNKTIQDGIFWERSNELLNRIRSGYTRYCINIDWYRYEINWIDID